MDGFRWVGLVLFGAVVCGVAAGQEPVSFEATILPVIESRCMECHGAETQRGALRFDTPDGFRAGSQFGAVLTAGKPDESAIIERITMPAEHEDRMPAKGDPLSPETIDAFRRWIAQGADFGAWNPPPPPKKKFVVRDLSYIPSVDEMPEGMVSFNKDIRAILSNNCFKCHGPDEEARKAELRLDIRDEALKLRDGVAAIVPNKLTESELVWRIFNADDEIRMPPPDSEKTLTREEQVLLAAWIAQGAEYEPHWSYIPPSLPDLPVVGAAEWIRNPIDQFVLARLESEGITPSPEADARTLARRVSLDLVGLPPDADAVERFAVDPSDEAYAQYVEALLASPHYGERMATDWLDQVRYADTNGYHSDESRSVSPYRDYVIAAFNDNMRYDQFTVEQLAGDLLPEPTITQQIASSYNRMNQLTAEGGAQPGEYRAKYAADRVRAIGSIWLGATLGCAECHDHKFDPISTKEFYQFAAFFADIEERDVYVTGEDWDPLLFLPTPEEKARLAELDAKIAEMDAQLCDEGIDLSAGLAQWEASVRADVAKWTQEWQPAIPSVMVSEGGATLTMLDDCSVLATGENPIRETTVITIPTQLENITGVRVEALSHWTLGRGISRAGTAPYQLTEIAVESYAPGDHGPQPVKIASASEDKAFLGSVASLAIDGELASAWSYASRQTSGDRASAVFAFEKPIAGGPGTEITVTMRFTGLNARTAIGRFRLSLTTMDAPAVSKEIGVPEAVLAAVLKDGDARTADESAAIVRYYRSIAPELEDARTRLTKAHDEKIALHETMLSTMITRTTEPRVTRVLPRGDWLRTDGEVVEPGVPEVMPALAVDDRRANRLDLARWLVSRDNPMTARVFVNRLWEQYFGVGMSAVLDDMGSQGEWPTHPELLDWLAVEFMESGWDVKHMVRLMVTSSTYRQASRMRPELETVDPKNRLLARQSRRRLEAEFVRDNALKVSGLLSETIGGRSVKPYQPEGYWRNANTFGGESLAYKPSAGEDQYRRGMYTYWKRSFLHPSMLSFDAPSREECVAQRRSSNTPLQALTLLNDPTYVEAAGALAERMIREGGSEPDARIVWAFRTVLSREPNADEVRVLNELQRAHAAVFAEDGDGAKQLVDVGQRAVPEDIDVAELAAWTSVARALLNLPETITRL